MLFTAAGAPRDFRYRTRTPPPCEVVRVFLRLTLGVEAVPAVFGANAKNARLRDVPGFADPRGAPLLLQRQADRRRAAGSLAVWPRLAPSIPRDESSSPARRPSAPVVRSQSERDHRRPPGRLLRPEPLHPTRSQSNRLLAPHDRRERRGRPNERGGPGRGTVRPGNVRPTAAACSGCASCRTCGSADCLWAAARRWKR